MLGVGQAVPAAGYGAVLGALRRLPATGFGGLECSDEVLVMRVHLSTPPHCNRDG